ncbi:MAG: hypothetical protein Q7R49_04890 [Candidatus Daviesbacteria bacterium]|nr:hypothetical protein [Candidatus Daviesbacteria bacterium]
MNPNQTNPNDPQDPNTPAAPVSDPNAGVATPLPQPTPIPATDPAVSTLTPPTLGYQPTFTPPPTPTTPSYPNFGTPTANPSADIPVAPQNPPENTWSTPPAPTPSPIPTTLDTSSAFSAAPTPPPAPDNYSFATTPTTVPAATPGEFNPFSSPTTPSAVPEPGQPAPEPPIGSFGNANPDSNPFSAGTNPAPTEAPVSDFSAQNLYAPTPPDQYGNPQATESAPTDLSHLIDPTVSTTDALEPTIPQPDTLVTPDGNETVPNLTPETQSKQIPKWVIGVAIGILIIVVGASAYFILGIGQTPQQSTSLPATQQPLQAPPTPRATILPNSTPAPATTSAGPASFGALQSTPSASPTSAADLLRQRQQQQQTP